METRLWWSPGFPQSIMGLMMLVMVRPTGRRLTGDNAVIIAAGGAHFGTVGGAKQHKYCELRVGPSRTATCSRPPRGRSKG